MSPTKKIKTAIISVYYKDGLEDIIRLLHQHEVTIYSTGGTLAFIQQMGIPCIAVESITGYPEILGGRVKTLHPAVFSGLLARTHLPDDIAQMEQHKLPIFDLMICNLYPFEEYLAKEADHDTLIEKIDIGGVSLIRAAAKNYKDVLCISAPEDYTLALDIFTKKGVSTTIEDRKSFAERSFRNIANYDLSIANWFANTPEKTLRYGENPHQKGKFVGDFDALFDQLNGKEISYNNMLDIDAGVKLLRDFGDQPTFAILKHNNSCGLAIADTLEVSYVRALACDPTSAFGGVLITNQTINLTTAELMHSLFFEILIAPAYDADALELLKGKKNRILLVQKTQLAALQKQRTILNGSLVQDADIAVETRSTWSVATKRIPTNTESSDLEFGIIAVKHLKSNGIALVKDGQLIGMGCGQTSRIDALQHAIKKANEFGHNLEGAIMASDAFFPFADCVEIAYNAGIRAIAQPGGSIKDADSIAYCDSQDMAMVMTGVRHFNH